MGIEELTIEIQKSDDTRFINIYGAYEELLSSFYCREEGESLLDIVKRQKGKSSYLHRKSELVDKLCMAGIEARYEMSMEELKECVKRLPDGVTMDKKMFDVLFNLYHNFETPADQMKKIVRKNGIKKYQDCSVRLSILKQFILNTDYHTGPVKEMIRTKIHTETGRIIPRKNREYELLADWADEGLFNVLNFKLEKAEKKKYALLRLCDDLAMGRFRTNGSTRQSLYMFAFAFDMMAYPDMSVKEYNPDKDIEKNLFFDYYKNHMLRFLKSEEQESSSDYESAPSGEGINYKNFAEVIYIYYLSRKDLEIRDRMKKAEIMIERCRSKVAGRKILSGEKAYGKTAVQNENYTYVYKDSFLEMLYKTKEDEIPEFIQDHFLCYSGDGYISSTKFSVSSETMTAMYHYKAFLKNRFSAQDNKRFSVEKLLVENPEWDHDYVRLIRKMNDMLHPAIKAGNAHLTRDEMIAVFYDHCLSGSGQEGLSLKELYDDCCQKLNPVLADSRFMSLMLTNIFDMFMVIMLYRYLNIV